MGPRSLLLMSLLVVACGDQSGTGPPPSPHVTGELAFIPQGEVAYAQGGAIVIRNFTDSSSRRIELDTANMGAVNGLTWRPDGSALVYDPYNLRLDHFELHLVPLDGSPESVLYPGEGHHAYPAFGPDGRLAYWAEFSGRQMEDILVDGQPIFPSACCALEGRPAWAPDGSAMVAVNTSREVDQLIQLNLATGAIRVLRSAASGQYFRNPVYSHAGDRVAFTSITSAAEYTSANEIWVMGADGKNPHLLVTGHADDMATWSPDDAWIAFARTEPPAASICMVPSAGGQVTTLVERAIVADWR